jgi:hypothetical protein
MFHGDQFICKCETMWIILSLGTELPFGGCGGFAAAQSLYYRDI